ncbi:hypothetical protein Tco_1124707 [Tanacetum coccineum]|uniref:Uncharacterized protein n=1 Tax=Tanacetum coccineum TaxID=301880 RepID=A0ABQ5J6W6_9ASTR
MALVLAAAVMARRREMWLHLRPSKVSTARLGVNVYTASYHEFVLLRIVLSTAHWNFSTASSLFILLVSTASVSRYRTTKIDGMADIEWHTEIDIGQNWKTIFI